MQTPVGAVVLGHEPGTVVREAANPGARPLTRLVKIGGRLAVLGMLHTTGPTPDAEYRLWHLARPGTIGHPDAVTGLTFATSLCRRNIVTNGYASDFTPADGVLCPACKEQA